MTAVGEFEHQLQQIHISMLIRAQWLIVIKYVYSGTAVYCRYFITNLRYLFFTWVFPFYAGSYCFISFMLLLYF